VTYEAVPGIDDDRCLGAKRCGLCIQACPVAAIGVRENDVAIAKDRCVTCGICVSTCPAAAIAYPGASFGEYEAEIGALLRRPSRLLFACAKNRVRDVPLGTGWAPIDVPCLGMVTPGWILQSLAAGASAVALLPCDSCEGGSAARAASRLEYVRALLGEIGDAASDDRVALLPSAPTSALPHPSPLSAQPAARVTLAEPAATVEAVLALAGSRNGAQDVRLSHPGSPLGIVRVRRETCTLCGACADACPTRALERGDTAAASLLSYDPALCIACERCAAVCPEGASETIEVHRVTDTAALAHGRATLKRDAVVCCRKCGRPVAPQAMLDRVRTMLEDENGAGPLLDVLTALCADCRSLATWS
jgi:ferredoxin